MKKRIGIAGLGMVILGWGGILIKTPVAQASCSDKYQKAAAALDESRSQCARGEVSRVDCQIMATVSLGTIFGDKVGVFQAVSIGEIYSFLTGLGIIPNPYRRMNRFLEQAEAGSGGLLSRKFRRYKKKYDSRAKFDEFVKRVNDGNQDESLCSGGARNINQILSDMSEE